MKVLIINNYDSFVYNLAQLVEETTFCELKVISYDQLSDKHVEWSDKVIISPGPGIPSDFPNLEVLVRKYYTQKDILGVCLGHEAIALAFGGAIHQSGKVFHGFTKKTRILDSNHFIFKGVPDLFDAGLYHSWILKKECFPEDLVITAQAEDGVIMALAHKQFNVVGFQFHPESIMTPWGKQMVGNWLTINPSGSAH